MFNWLDIVLLIILALTLILGIIKGLIRQLIGILAVLVGLVLSIFYYSAVGALFRPLVASDAIAHLLGFLTIFCLVLLLGWLLSRIINKLMKGGIKFFDHVMGGAFGIIKGTLICTVVVFALVVFPVNVKALKRSLLAPYCVWLTKAIIEIIPEKLKDKFEEIYSEITNEKGEESEGL